MAYIGKQPTIGNFQVCDAISVVNGQAAYTMQVSSSNVEPESANHMLVSLNGILQKPGSSFTISGSTITFASNLVTNDVIDFIMLLGNVLDLGTPSDATVTTAKLGADAVTAAKIADDAVESEHLNNNIISGQTALAEAPADTDEFLLSDGGTIKRIDYSHIKGGGAYEKLVTTTVSSSANTVEFNSTYFTTAHRDYKVVITGLEPSADDEQLAVRFSSDNGSSFLDSSDYDQGAFGARSDSSGAAAPTGRNIANNNRFLITGVNASVGSGTGEKLHAHIEIFDPLNQNSDNQFLTVMWDCVIVDADAAKVQRGSGAGVFNASGAEDTVFNAISIFMASGTIDKGSFTLYGRKI